MSDEVDAAREALHAEDIRDCMKRIEQARETIAKEGDKMADGAIGRMIRHAHPTTGSEAMNKRKPMRVFYSIISGRFYATRAWKEIKPGLVEVTGEKFDVTDDIAAAVIAHDVVFCVSAKGPKS